jgi:hypothetical protein
LIHQGFNPIIIQATVKCLPDKHCYHSIGVTLNIGLPSRFFWVDVISPPFLLVKNQHMRLA